MFGSPNGVVSSGQIHRARERGIVFVRKSAALMSGGLFSAKNHLTYMRSGGRGGKPPRRNIRHGLFLALALGFILLGGILYLLVALVKEPPQDGKDNSAYQSANNSTT